MTLFTRTPWASQPQITTPLRGGVFQYLDSYVQWNSQGLGSNLGFTTFALTSAVMSRTPYGLGVSGDGALGYLSKSVSIGTAAPHLLLVSFVYKTSPLPATAYAFGENLSAGARLDVTINAAGSIQTTWRKDIADVLLTGPVAVIGTLYNVAVYITSDTPANNIMFVNGVRYTGTGTGGGTATTFAFESINALRRNAEVNRSVLPIFFTGYGKRNAAVVDVKALENWTVEPLSIFTPLISQFFIHVASPSIVVTPTGVEAIGSIGTVTVSAGAVAPITGVEAVGAIGTATGVPITIATVTGVEVTGSIGLVTVYLLIVVPVSGVEATTAIGVVTVANGATVTPAGVVGYGLIGQVNVWGLVDDSQSPGWNMIPDTQTPAWGAVPTSQTPNWQPIVA